MSVLDKINRILGEGFEEGDLVKITYGEKKGSIGRIVEPSPQGNFYIVKVGSKTYSYHESDLVLKKKMNEAEGGATVVANVEKNPQAATNMVRRQNQYRCADGQKWCPVRKKCIPEGAFNEGMESDISLVRMVAKDHGVNKEISDAEATKIIRLVKQRGSKEDFYYNLKEYFLN